MQLALYGEHGFYIGGGAAGRRGDFITQPEVGPLFGAVLARALDGWWRQLGEPADFTVVEAGAGPGTLARRSSPPSRPRRGATSRSRSSAAQRAPPSGRGRVASPSCRERPITGVIVANELLDNLPFRLFVLDGGWREAYVVADGDGTSPRCSPAARSACRRGCRPTRRTARACPSSTQAAAWVERRGGAAAPRPARRHRLRHRHDRRARGRPWRRVAADLSRSRARWALPRRPGAQDITAEVRLDQLPHARRGAPAGASSCSVGHRRPGRGRPPGVDRQAAGAHRRRDDDAQPDPRGRSPARPPASALQRAVPRRLGVVHVPAVSTNELAKS